MHACWNLSQEGFVPLPDISGFRVDPRLSKALEVSDEDGTSADGRYCCKSLFGVSNENS
jgi:hypothetical protein